MDSLRCSQSQHVDMSHEEVCKLWNKSFNRLIARRYMHRNTHEHKYEQRLLHLHNEMRTEGRKGFGNFVYS